MSDPGGLAAGCRGGGRPPRRAGGAVPGIFVRSRVCVRVCALGEGSGGQGVCAPRRGCEEQMKGGRGRGSSPAARLTPAFFKRRRSGAAEVTFEPSVRVCALAERSRGGVQEGGLKPGLG